MRHYERVLYRWKAMSRVIAAPYKTRKVAVLCPSLTSKLAPDYLPTMGGTQSSQNPAKAHLIFSGTSLHNNEVVCQEYDVRYHISQPSGIFSSSKTTTITRSDPDHTSEPYVAAQWERNSWSKDRLQVTMNGPDFARVCDVFPRTSTFFGWR